MIKLCKLSDLPEAGKQLFLVDGKELLAIKTSDRIFVVSNRCPHAGGKLDKGRVEDGTITCPEHGLCFDLRNGFVCLDRLDDELLEMIDVDNLPFGPLKTYETLIEDGILYIKD